MILASKTNQYDIGKQVAEADAYRLYLCTQKSTGRQCLLQIASEVIHNPAIDLTAFYLTRLKNRSDELEAEFAKIKEADFIFLNYDLGFPELIEGWACQEQGGRRINILAFRRIEDVTTVVPLHNITTRDHLRVDLRTSAWIMGKSLKLLVFAHDFDVSVGNVGTRDILIQPDEHYVVFFNWTGAKSHTGGVPSDVKRHDISQAAKAIITIIGGDFEKRAFPNFATERAREYIDFLMALANGKMSDAARVHSNFYELINSIWERKFYPFTSYKL